MNADRSVVPLLALAVGSLGAAAGGGRAAEPPAFALTGPEVYKLDWNTRSLVAHDLDSDGRTDLAVLNNDRAKVEILYQGRPDLAAGAERRVGRGRERPPRLESSRFGRESVVTGVTGYALAAGDLNGDGLPDLAYTGNPDALTVLHQGPKGEWSRTRISAVESPSQWGGTLAITDLDADGRSDLVALTERAVAIFPQLRTGELGPMREYALSDEGCHGLVIHDVDGDGLRDLMYVAPNTRYAWRMRFQRRDGGFGPERIFAIEPPRGELHPLGAGGEGRNAFVMIQAQSGLIEMLELRPTATKDPLSALSPRVYSTPGKESGAGSYALGDFDADGALDIAVADRRGAQVWLYLGREDGGFGEPTAFPSLSDLRSAAAGDVDGDGAAELFVVSPREATIGMAHLSAGGRLTYPSPLPVTGKPLAATASDLDGDGHAELAYVREMERVRGVVILDRDAAGGSWREISEVELAGLATSPMALTALDADQDERPDLVVFTLQNPLRFLIQQADGSFRDASASASFRKGLVSNVVPAAFSTGDVDGDGKAEFIVAGEGFARALRMTKQGDLEVVDQFNASRGGQKVEAALIADLDGDRAPEALLAEKGSETLQVLKKDANGVYRRRAEVSVGRIDLVETSVVEGGGGPRMIFMGKDRFWSVPVLRRDLRPRSLGVHESDLEDVVFGDLAVGDLNGDGREDLLALDSTETRILQVLSRSGDSGWSRELHFSVFDTAPHYQGRRGFATEPREMLVSDLTADGRPDVALLVHDRILIYPAR